MANNESTSSKKRKLQMDLEFCVFLSNNLKELYEAEILCNVTLIAGENGKKIPAHRAVLAAASPFFRAMFANDFKEKNQSEIVLKLIDGDILKILIDFCYSGIIDINETNVYEILNAAVLISFIYVENKCRQYLAANLNISNCLSMWVNLEHHIDFDKLAQSAQEMAKTNFLKVADEHEFLLLEADYMFWLLEKNDLEIWSEEIVFNALEKWVNYDENIRRCYVKDLLSTIRLTALKSEFLEEKVKKFCEKFDCLNVIENVKNWKSDPDSQPKHVLPPRASTTVKKFITVGDTDSECYCPNSNKWSMFENINYEFSKTCSVFLDTKLYILGGWCSKRTEAVNVVRKFNYFTNEMKEVKPMIKNRADFAVAVLNNCIYVAGGFDRNSVERYDKENDSWTEVPAMSIKRRNLALVSFEGKLYAIGGIQGSKILCSVECFDPVKNDWEPIAGMNRTRSYHGAFAHKNRLYVVGGVGKNEPIVTSLEYYDPTVNKWFTIQTGINIGYGFGFATYGLNFILIAGGNTGLGNSTKTAFKINLNTFQTEEVAAMNKPKFLFNLHELPWYNFDT